MRQLEKLLQELMVFSKSIKNILDILSDKTRVISLMVRPMTIGPRLLLHLLEDN